MRTSGKAVVRASGEISVASEIIAVALQALMADR